MTKEIDNKTCECCESSYRLVYDPNNTSGYAKFCPFCGSEIYDDEDSEIKEYDDE